MRVAVIIPISYCGGCHRVRAVQKKNRGQWVKHNYLEHMKRRSIDVLTATVVKIDKSSGRVLHLQIVKFVSVLLVL